jgi:uncharacterized FAD-dependent dehydrogenase
MKETTLNLLKDKYFRVKDIKFGSISRILPQKTTTAIIEEMNNLLTTFKKISKKYLHFGMVFKENLTRMNK